MNDHEYRRLIRPHERVIRQLLLDFEFFRSDVGPLNVYSIDSRIKSLHSATLKSEDLGILIHNLEDLGGIRIVTATSSEVLVVKRFFSRKEVSNDLKIEKDKAIHHANGYRSTHLVVKFSGHYSRSSQSGRIEIQIPTIFEHAFNFISRSWSYKSTVNYPRGWRERFVSVAERLEELDDEVKTLHDKFIRISAKNPKTQLSPLAYQRAVHEEFGETAPAVEDAVDACKFYFEHGVETVGQLRAFFSNTEIKELWDQFVRMKGIDRKLVHRKDEFWSFFGTRMDMARRYLDSLKK